MNKMNEVLEGFTNFLLVAGTCTPFVLIPLALILSVSTPPPEKTPEDFQKEYAYQQTMQKLYEPVGNGGAASTYADMKEKGYLAENLKWDHPSFGTLAAMRRNNPQRSDMYRKMDKYYKETMGGK